MSALLDHTQKQQTRACQLDAILEVLVNNQEKLEEGDAMRLLHAALHLSGELVDGLDCVNLPKEDKACGIRCGRSGPMLNLAIECNRCKDLMFP